MSEHRKKNSFVHYSEDEKELIATKNLVGNSSQFHASFKATKAGRYEFIHKVFVNGVESTGYGGFDPEVESMFVLCDEGYRFSLEKRDCVLVD